MCKLLRPLERSFLCSTHWTRLVALPGRFWMALFLRSCPTTACDSWKYRRRLVDSSTRSACRIPINILKLARALHCDCATRMQNWKVCYGGFSQAVTHCGPHSIPKPGYAVRAVSYGQILIHKVRLSNVQETGYTFYPQRAPLDLGR